MLPKAPIIRFIVVAAFVYASLLLAWNIVQKPYIAAFNKAAALLFSPISDQLAISIREISDQPVNGLDTEVVFHNAKAHSSATLPISLRQIGYLPMVVVIALLLATPWPLHRRLSGVSLGTALILVFVALRLWLIILTSLCGDSPIAVFHWSAAVQELVRFARETLADSLASTFFGPVVIWMGIAFRRSDRKLVC